MTTQNMQHDWEQPAWLRFLWRGRAAACGLALAFTLAVESESAFAQETETRLPTPLTAAAEEALRKQASFSRLGSDSMPQLTLEEMETPRTQAMIGAMGGDPYAHRAAEFACAGMPQWVRAHAIPSYTRHYGGYYVGGGVPIHGEGRYINEGTWGWDYFGIAFQKRIALNWSHGARYQGGLGAYKTDGPKIEHERE